MHPEQASPYSVEAYHALLGRLVEGGWTFAPFVVESPAAGRRVYLRHDVDYSLELAVELAELNSAAGVQGTFFVQVRAQFYNVFSPHETARIRRLASLGQRLGLHYVPAGTGADDAAAIRSDFELLGTVAPHLDPVFSWHRPMHGFDEPPRLDVPGLVNVYGERFFHTMPYLSDSIHRVGVGELQSSLASLESRELHLLLHPVNWIAGGSSGVEILIRGWLRVLRDHERTLLENDAYSARFPQGMTTQLVAEFGRRLLSAAGSAS